LLVEGADVELASIRGTRRLPLTDFLVGPKRNALAENELIVAVHIEPSGAAQTFMKIGPRNAMVIAVCSLALAVDREREEVRASFGSAGPVAGSSSRRSRTSTASRARRRRGEPDRRRPRHGRVPPARAARAHAPRAREVPRR
jgi:CO/xanthine dehydrogenase FAD-binding subunit